MTWNGYIDATYGQLLVMTALGGDVQATIDWLVGWEA